MKNIKAYLMIILITVLWGISFPIMDFCLGIINPYNFVFIRYFTSALFMTVVCFKAIKTIDKKHMLYSSIIGVPFALAVTMQMVGLDRTTSVNAAFLTGLTVIVVPIIVWLKDKNIPNKVTFLGIFISIIGVSFLTLANGFTGVNSGDLIVFFATICFSFQIYLLGKHGEMIDPVKLTIIQFYIVSFFTLPFVKFTEINPQYFSSKMILYLLFIIVICTVWALGVQNKFQHMVNASHVGIIFLLEPVLALFTSYLMGDVVTLNQIIGATILMISMVFIIKSN